MRLLRKLYGVYGILPADGKKRFIQLIIISVLNSVIDLIVLSTVFPLLYIVSHKNDLFQNKYFKYIYDYLNLHSFNEFIMLVFGLIILAFLFRAMFFIYAYHKQSVLAYLIGDIFFKFMNSYLFHQDIVTYKRMSYGEIDQKSRSVPYQLAYLVLLPLSLILTEILVFSFLIIGVFWYNPKIFFGIVVLVILPIIILYFLLKEKIREMGKKMHKKAVELNNTGKNIIRGYADIYLLNQQEFFIQKLLEHQQEYNFYNRKSSTIQQSFPRIVELIAISSIFLLLVFFIINDIPYETIALNLTVYFASAYRLMPSINRINASLLVIKQYEHLLDEFKEVIVKSQNNDQYKKEKTCEYEKFENIRFNDKILLENVYISYKNSNDKLVLKDINLEIKKGEMIGIIGKSGAGKTTLMYTLAGLILPQKGRLLVDEQEIGEYNVHQWFKHLAIVFQEPYILDDSWVKNIAYGATEINSTKVWDALRMVQLENYIKNLPNQINEKIGDSGSFLSGGQKQRLALARALYRDADVLLLDEATSALDETTQEEIMRTINEIRLQKKITVIIIAHRYTSLRYCDKVLLLENGKISQYLKFNELFNIKQYSQHL